MGIKTSFTVPFASVDVAELVQVELDARLATGSYFLEFGAGFLIPGNFDSSARSYCGLVAELGASAYLSDTDISSLSRRWGSAQTLVRW